MTAAAVLLFIGNQVAWRRQLAGRPSNPTPAADVPAIPSTGAEIDAFYRQYDNALLVETEDHLRAQLAPYQSPQDRERFLLRSCATIVLLGTFEYVWLLIYRSQLRAMGR